MSTGKLRSKGEVAKMLVHLVETVEHGAEIFRADGSIVERPIASH